MTTTQSDFDQFIDGPILGGDATEVMDRWMEEYASARQEGGTALHWACKGTEGDSEGVVRALLTLGCDTNAVTNADHWVSNDGVRNLKINGRGWKTEWTPLHVCAQVDNQVAMSILLETGRCNLGATTPYGETPLRIALNCGHSECEKMLRAEMENKKNVEAVSKQLELVKNNSLLKIMNPETGMSLLEQLLNGKDQKVLEAIKAKQVDEEEMNEWKSCKILPAYSRSYQSIHECLMYRCIHQNYDREVYSLCTADIVNRASLFMGPTALKTAVECGAVVWVHEILRKVVKVDQSWSTAEDIAKSKNFLDIHDMLTKRRDYLTGKNKKGLSRLHIAVIENDPDMVEYIIKNDPAIAYESHKIPPLFIDVDPDIKTASSNIPLMTITNRETIHSLCLKSNRTIYPCLLESIDRHTVNRPDGINNSLLHLAAVSLMPDLCYQLISKSAEVNSKNDSGSTPLLELLKRNSDRNIKEGETSVIETVNVLIDGGASLDVEDVHGCSVLEMATLYCYDTLLLALIRKYEHIDRIRKPQLLAWLNKGYFSLVKEVIPLLNKGLLNEWITRDLIKEILVDSNISLAKIMYDHGSYDVKIDVVEAMLYRVAIIGDKDLFKTIIKDDISSNSSLDKEESLLHSLIQERKREFIQLVIRSRHGHWFIEKKNTENKLPLHVCIENDYWEVVDQLIVDTSNVDEQDNNGNTALSLLLTKISETDDETTISRLMIYVKQLINNSANIYLVNKRKITVLTYCTKSDLKKEIESHFQRHQQQPKPSKICSII